MNYLQLLQKGLRFVVKSALEEAATQRAEDICLYITFKTSFPGVAIPQELVEKYPNNMTIVLQHEFWNLNVSEQAFSVDLMFSGVLQNLTVPFNSIYRFEDPNEPFSLDFIVDAVESDFLAQNIFGKPGSKSQIADQLSDSNIIDLNAFRKNKQEHSDE